jgi:hypothetical protein
MEMLVKYVGGKKQPATFIMLPRQVAEDLMKCRMVSSYVPIIIGLLTGLVLIPAKSLWKYWRRPEGILDFTRYCPPGKVSTKYPMLAIFNDAQREKRWASNSWWKRNSTWVMCAVGLIVGSIISYLAQR